MSPSPVRGRGDSDADVQAVAIIAGFFVARLAFSLAVGLGVDESYTLVVSRRLAWSYFDHPPLHQWLAHFSALALGETVLARIPFVALFALTGWLLYRLTAELFGPRAGVYALYALNVSAFFFASAGSWIVPDGPLLCALAAAALALARIFVDPQLHPSRIWRRWLTACVCFGLAGLSKYSAALTAAGVVALILTSPSQRRWLRHPAPYVAAALAVAMTIPVFVWNSEHGWVSFAFQGGRGEIDGGLRPLQLAQMALGEIAYLTPWLAVPLVMALVQASQRWRDERLAFLLALSLPSIVIFTVTPLWGARGFPHWPMPGWFFVFPLLGAWLDAPWSAHWNLRRAAVACAAALGIVAVAVTVEARTGWLAAELPLRPGQSDPTLEAFSWGALSEAPLLLPPPKFVVATKWSDAGKIGVALGPDVPILTLSDDPRGMAFLQDGAAFVDHDGVLIVPIDRVDAALATAKPLFREIGARQTLTLGRLGRPEITLALVPLGGLTRAPPMPYPDSARR